MCGKCAKSLAKIIKKAWTSKNGQNKII
jgi:bacterioferritin-associated ferredoxin